MTSSLNPERDIRFAFGIELRAAAPESQGPGTLVGYACVWESVGIPILGRFREKFTRGAFTRSLKTIEVIACSDHEENEIAGRTMTGTLRLTEDDHGLRYENVLPDTTLGRDLAVLVSRGDISGVSVAFIAQKQSWDYLSEPPLRTVSEADLYHLSYEARPAYNATSVSLRSIEAAKAEALKPPPEPTATLPVTRDANLARLIAAEAY